jgi:hypothetical protein
MSDPAGLPEDYAQLKGSERHLPAAAKVLGPADENETISVTLVLRRRLDGPPMPKPGEFARTPLNQRRRLPQDEFAAKYGAAPADIDKLAQFARSNGLTVVESHAAQRAVVVSGTVGQMSRAFAVKLERYQVDAVSGDSKSPGGIYRGRDGFVQLPKALSEIVIGVFGLDNGRVGHNAGNPGDPTVTNLLTVQQVTTLYNFPPPGPGIAGQTIGIMAPNAGYAGYLQSDLDLYFGGSHLTPIPISVDGASNGTLVISTTVETPSGQNNLFFASGPPAANILANSWGQYTLSGVTYYFSIYSAAQTGTTTTVNIGNFLIYNGTTYVSAPYPEVPAGTTVYINLDDETTQDICIAGSAAPGASVAVYFAPATEQGWVDLIKRALHPNNGDFPAGVNPPSVLSSSWFLAPGDDAAGLTFTNTYFHGLTAMAVNTLSGYFNDALVQNVTVCNASGDAGAEGIYNLIQDNYAHVAYPSSDPNVLAVGGTTIGKVQSSGGSYVWVEYVWNDGSGATGGGVSDFFPPPSWQSQLNVTNVNLSVNPSAPFNQTGRGVPDVAANASQSSSYSYYLGGAPYTSGGGTSAATPLWAGLIALINSNLGSDLGSLNPVLYTLGAQEFSGPNVFNPINPLWPENLLLQFCPSANTYNNIQGYTSGPSWDACTGWGSPDGIGLLNGLVLNLSTQDVQFWLDDNTFSADEVKNVSSYPNAFWLALDGFTPNILGITNSDPSGSVTVTLSGSFVTLLRATNIVQGTPILENGTNLYAPQRILIPFTITFPPGISFPSSGEVAYTMSASVYIYGYPTLLQAGPVLFELTAGEDPRFQNIDPSQDNDPWFSQDLRVFTIAPQSSGATPIGNIPFTFGSGSPTQLDTGAAYSYIQALLGYFNDTYNDPNGPVDPFSPSASVFPQGEGAGVYQGDSSVTPTTTSGGETINNYNFAIARVRLAGSPGMTAPNVKVFFRLFGTQTNDTDYINTSSAISTVDPSVTYPSNPSGDPNNPASPLPGVDSMGNVVTIPFFADPNQKDLQPPASGDPDPPYGVNNQTIAIPQSGAIWTYFGCFLNVYDPNNMLNGQQVQYWLAGGAHHCIVAQIAYGGAPIVNSNGVVENPGNCDKLAQRNLQVTPSGQPGFPATHRIPQTFDVRPSPPPPDPAEYLTNYPDELMIDWGTTPIGSVAHIYWPQVESAEVIGLASKFYTTHLLAAADAHTVECKVVGGAAYVPIPARAGPNFAGLLTLNVPTGIRFGDVFNVVVRRITSRRPPWNRALGNQETNAKGSRANWRNVVGAFQLQIPVQPEEESLPAEENLLAVLKWRLSILTPKDRWRPVLLRYIEIVEGRVKGMGGNPSQILPSRNGTAGQGEKHGKHPGEAIVESAGKISGLAFDRFGDFDGFFLLTEAGEERYFRSSEQEIERLARSAWTDRTFISVFAQSKDPHTVASIVLRRTPHW